MGWRETEGPPSWRANEERRKESPSCRADSGGHISAFEGKGYTSPKTMRGDAAGDLTIRHADDPVGSEFKAFPTPDDGDLTLQAPAAAEPKRERLAAAAADSIRGGLRSLGRMVFGGR